MGLKEWAPVQKELEQLFSGGAFGVVGGERLSPVLDSESAYGGFIVREFHGYDIVENSFFDFMVESLSYAAENALKGQLPKDDQDYLVTFATYFSIFRRLRAASILKNNGHPLAGFALLRDVSNYAILLGAVASGKAQILALHGFGSRPDPAAKLTPDEFKKIRNSAKDARDRALRLMVGKDSGLDKEVVEELEILKNLYHEETHNSQMVLIQDIKALAIDQRLPFFGPDAHERNLDASMFLNRFIEIAWLVLRCLPFLQLSPGAFGAAWCKKWALLDSAIRMQVDGLAEIGKRIGILYPKMVDAQFPFNPDTHYKIEEHRKSG